MRDIGGAAFLLTMLASGGNFLFNFNKLENMLVEQLYKKPSVFWQTKKEIVGPKTLKAES